ncbi:hypothetical protein E1A91_D01G039500v1 [Gossypium mustelinum]|uniref:RNase H type-1 domain-containing protein n=1 Tax=Gossypium mustelinum TaxID=34275 RepID=A0A5D2W385_GOSMU|nr:hypothetical protein E1A91_D01G039500v1 [Gossypium mustelinum]
MYNEIILTESSWWFCPLKCRSHNKTYKGLETSWRFPPRGWLKFNVCGVVFEDKAGGGGVLRDEGVARAFFSSPSEAKDAEFAELKSIGVALELYEGMGWATCCPLLIEVGSNVVFKWLSETESRPGKLYYFFAEIERSYLSFEKAEHMGNKMEEAEHMGNKMTFALAIAGVKHLDTFKAWGFVRFAFIGLGRVYCML